MTGDAPQVLLQRGVMWLPAAGDYSDVGACRAEEEAK